MARPLSPQQVEAKRERERAVVLEMIAAYCHGRESRATLPQDGHQDVLLALRDALLCARHARAHPRGYALCRASDALLAPRHDGSPRTGHACRKAGRTHAVADRAYTCNRQVSAA